MGGVHTSRTPFLASPDLAPFFLAFLSLAPPPPLFLPLPTLLDLWNPDLYFPPPVRPRPHSLEAPTPPPPEISAALPEEFVLSAILDS